MQKQRQAGEETRGSPCDPSPGHSHVQGLLCLEHLLLGAVADQGAAVRQVQVECDQRAVLHAQSPQGGAINLGRGGGGCGQWRRERHQGGGPRSSPRLPAGMGCSAPSHLHNPKPPPPWGPRGVAQSTQPAEAAVQGLRRRSCGKGRPTDCLWLRAGLSAYVWSVPRPMLQIRTNGPDPSCLLRPRRPG